MNFQTRYNRMNDKECEICKGKVQSQCIYMVASQKEFNTYAEIYMHLSCYAQVTQNSKRYENLKARMSELCRG